jgi:hypothetical protein
LDVIEKEGEKIAVVFLPGVHYFTGQYLDIERITKAAHDKVLVESMLFILKMLDNNNEIKGLFCRMGSSPFYWKRRIETS